MLLDKATSFRREGYYTSRMKRRYHRTEGSSSAIKAAGCTPSNLGLMLQLCFVLLLFLDGSNGWIASTISTKHDISVGAATQQTEMDTGRCLSPGLPTELADLSLLESMEYPKDTTEGTRRQRTVERVSMNPPIFILRNALTPEECRGIREAASKIEFEQGKTVTCDDDDDDESKGKEPRRFSRVGWLSNELPLVEDVARSAHGVFLNGMPFHATRGIEPLQVVHYYDVGGEYINHHDDNHRLLTVLYYLNGVGETWFPLADNYDGPTITDSLMADKACEALTPERDGVLVTCRKAPAKKSGYVVANVQEGDAVAFYNYNMDGTKNWNAFHSGLPVTKSDLGAAPEKNGKWIANHFYHFVPSHVAPTPTRD